MHDTLGQVSIYTKLCLREAYFQTRIKEGDEWKAAIRTKFGLFKPLVMQFGLTNAPGCHQSRINSVLHKFLGKFVMVYLDDIIIFSKGYDEHVGHVDKILKELLEGGFRIKPKK